MTGDATDDGTTEEATRSETTGDATAADSTDGDVTTPGGGRTDSDTADERFSPDPERVRLLRAVADDVRGEDSESRQLAAILYRVSDLYDEHEDTSPAEIYRNVKTILEVKERGTMER